MSQSLYRKYRSRAFDEIIGQPHVTKLLKTAVEKGVFAHAYLFTGPRGTGKTSVARILAHAINDLPYSDDSLHLDIIEIDAASNRRIDDIRDLRDKVHIAPSSAKYKIYIIDEVHMLTGESFNALLKTLEEPPSHVVFILATTELDKVPATIISRTQRFNFRPGSVKDISEHLASIAKQESISIEDDALKLIARHSEGGFRDSVSLLDQVSSISDSVITVADIESLLGLAPSSQLDLIRDAILQMDSKMAINEVHQLLEGGMNPIRLSNQLIQRLYVSAGDHPKLYYLINQLLEIPKSHAPELKLLSTLSIWLSDSDSGAVIEPTKPASSINKAPVIEDKQPDEKTKSASVVETPPTQAKTKLKTTNNKSDKSQNSSASVDIDWQKILSDLKASAPALHGVVKQADASYQDNQLTLEVEFALHRKKLQTEKYTKQLVECIEKRYSVRPEIIIKPPSKRELDDVGSQVAQIMGGGEAIKL